MNWHKHGSTVLTIVLMAFVAAVFVKTYKTPPPDPWETVCKPADHPHDPMFCYR